MSEVVYSTIEEGDTGKLIAVSVPYDPSIDIQARMREWFDEEFARSLYA